MLQGALTADRVLLNARALGVYGASPIPQNGNDTLCVAPENFVIAAARQCRGNQTPAGNYQVNSIIWNPWWHPPDSDWARGRKVEPPGAMNPMGRAKLNFAPLLYIHGTFERGALGDPASRGCVRRENEDLIELTRLVHQYLTPDVDPATIDWFGACRPGVSAV